MPTGALRRLSWPLLLAALLAPGRAHAVGALWPLADNPRFWILGEGQGHFSFDAFYFQTRENYDNTGTPVTPAAEDRTHYTNFRFHGGYGFAPRFSVFAQAAAHALFESNTDANATAAPHNANQGFGDAFVGFRWLAWRNHPSDRVYPTEWTPDSIFGVIEGTWAFPMYDRADAAKPPLGDQSNDFTGMARLAWFANDWLALSGGIGYLYRTANYSSLMPWNLRADVSGQDRHQLRFWVDIQGFERPSDSGPVVNPSQPDPFPNGSLLFKSYAPVVRTATIGLGRMVGKEWELLAAGLVTASGVNSAKGWGGGLGIAWRPYQVPEIKYDEYRERQVERVRTERRELRQREVVRYGFRATVLRVSAKGNYLKIAYGAKDNVREGDTFYIYPPDPMTPEARQPVAFATVARTLPDAAFLHVDERFGETPPSIHEGFEARRVFFANDDH